MNVLAEARGRLRSTDRSRLGIRNYLVTSRLAKLAIFEQKFANFWRVRFRLFQNEFLQQDMRLTAFFKALQDLHPFAPLQSQNFRKKSV